MDEFIQWVIFTLFHPVTIAFVLGGIVCISFVAGTMCYYNRRGRGG